MAYHYCLSSGSVQEAPEFITKLIREYYRNAANIAPAAIEQREFGFGNYEKKISQRHFAFGSEKELKGYLVKNAPPYVSYSAAYYRYPDARPMETKEWHGAELIFDLDSTELNLPCQKEHGSIWVCKDCLQGIKDETIKLIEDFLIPDFGFSEQEISINFSGNRGYHLHITKPSVLKLSADARKEISNYISGMGMDFSEFFPTSGTRGAKLVGPKPDDAGWGGKIARSFVASLEKGPEKLASLGIDLPTAKKLYAKRALIELGIKGGNWDMVYIKKKTEFWKRISDKQAIMQSDMIDKSVTGDTSRLIRLPGTIHGETGLIAKKIGSLEELKKFDPMKDAIAFRNGEGTVEVESAMGFQMNGRTFGPYKHEHVRLPTYAAVYLILKGVAKVPSKHQQAPA